MLHQRNISRLRQFVVDMSLAADRITDSASLQESSGQLLADLVGHDDWLPPEYAEPHPVRYRQYLLHCDPAQRFSLVSFVWGPGQSTPIHDHRIWGVIGMLRGTETSQSYQRNDCGQIVPHGQPTQLRPGDIAYLSPEDGDIHKVHNGDDTEPSISIHVYGANIGNMKRYAYDSDGGEKLFISGYSNDAVPNLWDFSKVAT